MGVPPYLAQDLIEHLNQIKKRYYIIPTIIKNSEIDPVNIIKRGCELLR